MSIPAKDLSGTTLSMPFLLPVESELQHVEAVLRKEITSSVRTLAEAAGHILCGGGKRIRPALVALSARACKRSYDLDRIVRIASAVELIHMATLLHDDVVDGAEFRRGRAAANTLWGDHISVLAGDYMLAKAFSLVARVADVRVMEVLSSAAISMAEGEVRQIESRFKKDDPTESYLAVVRDKTAAFMSASCRIGAILACSPPAYEEALADYGHGLGMAFQITDDLLDLLGDPAQTGKPVGGDLREGNLTLPVIIAMDRSAPSDLPRLTEVVFGGDASPDDVEFVREMAEQTGAISETRAAVQSYIRDSIRSLRALPDSEFVRSLEALACHVATRDH